MALLGASEKDVIRRIFQRLSLQMGFREDALETDLAEILSESASTSYVDTTAGRHRWERGASTLDPGGSAVVVRSTKMCPLSNNRAYRPPGIAVDFDAETITVGDRGQVFNGADWYETSALPSPQAFGAVAMLLDGRVLCIGGIIGTELDDESFALGGIPENYTDVCYLYNPDTDEYTLTGALPEPADVQRAVRLQDGRVLVAGGLHGPDQGGPSTFSFPASTKTYVYNPDTELWTTVGDMTEARAMHALCVMLSGNVLAVGGTDFVSSNGPSGPTPFVPNSPTAEVWDKDTGNWTAVADEMPAVSETIRLLTGTDSNMATPLAGRSGVDAIAFGDKVLVVGGWAEIREADLSAEQIQRFTDIGVELSIPLARRSCLLFDEALLPANPWTHHAGLDLGSAKAFPGVASVRGTTTVFVYAGLNDIGAEAVTGYFMTPSDPVWVRTADMPSRGSISGEELDAAFQVPSGTFQDEYISEIPCDDVPGACWVLLGDGRVLVTQASFFSNFDFLEIDPNATAISIPGIPTPPLQ